MLNKNEYWSLVNRFIGLLGNAFILIIIAKLLISQEVALWYLFVAIFGVVGVIEGGITQTISRHITYISNGNTDHKGIDLNDFISVSSKYFHRIVLLIALLTLTLGSIYLIILGYFDNGKSYSIYWLLYIAGSCLSLMANLYASIAMGFQKVAHIQKNQIIATTFNVGFVVVLLLLVSWKSIGGIILGFLLSQTLLLILNYSLATKLFAQKNTQSNEKKIVSIAINDTKKMFLNMLSYKLLTSVFFMLLASFTSVDVLASYGMTVQAFTYISVFSIIFLTSNFPEFARLYSEQKYFLLKKIFLKKSAISLLVYLLFLIIFIISFSYFQRWFGLNIHILPNEILICFVLFSLIEYIISIIGNILLACNELRLMALSFLCAVIVLTSTYFLFYLGFGLQEVFVIRGLIDVVFILVPALIILKTLNAKMEHGRC